MDGFDDELASVDGGEDGAAGEPVEGWGKVEAEGGFTKIMLVSNMVSCGGGRTSLR